MTSKRTRGALVGALLTTLLSWPGAASTASAQTSAAFTAPYAADREWTSCDAFGDAFCLNQAAGEPAAGTIRTSSEVSAPALSEGSATAQAVAEVVASPIKTPRRDRVVETTAVVIVDSASVALTNTSHNEADHVSSALTVLLTANCSGCAGGYRTVFSTQTLADTDPATRAPESVAGETRTVTLTLTLGAGETFNGHAFVAVTGVSRPWTGRSSQFEVALMEQRVAASTNLTVERVDASTR
jgi:hypothetical protein